MATKNNVKRKPVTILLDKERTLVFDLNAFIELETIYGTIEDALSTLSQAQGKLKAVRTLLWAGLLHERNDEGKPFTQEDIGALITLENIQAISERLGEAVGEALPESEGKK